MRRALRWSLYLVAAGAVALAALVLIAWIASYASTSRGSGFWVRDDGLRVRERYASFASGRGGLSLSCGWRDYDLSGRARRVGTGPPPSALIWESEASAYPGESWWEFDVWGAGAGSMDGALDHPARRASARALAPGRRDLLSVSQRVELGSASRARTLCGVWLRPPRQ